MPERLRDREVLSEILPPRDRARHSQRQIGVHATLDPAVIRMFMHSGAVCAALVTVLAPWLPVPAKSAIDLQLAVTVITADGAPAREAYVDVTPETGGPPVRLAALGGGRFSGTVPDTRSVRLRIAAPDHITWIGRAHRPASGALVVRVALATPPVRTRIDSVRVVTNVDDFQWNAATALRKERDGHWRGSIETDRQSLLVSTIGVAARFNGTASTVWMSGAPVRVIPIDTSAMSGFADPPPEFAAELHAKNGRVSVDVDPRRWSQYTRATAEVSFMSGDADVDRANSIIAVMNTAAARGDTSGGMRQAFESLRCDATTSVAADAACASRAVLARRLSDSHAAAIADSAYRRVATGSWLWHSERILDALMLGQWEQLATLDSATRADSMLARLSPVLRALPTTRARVRAYFSLTGELADNPQAKFFLHRMLADARAQIPGDPVLETIANQFGAEPTLRVGAALPQFSLALLADSAGAPITNAALRGHITLLDFWGSWCAPCVSELPRLHRLHTEYAQRGFRIVSVLVADTPEQLRRFRATRFPMPWTHAYGGESPFDAPIRVFGLTGFPTAVLVDSTGRIVQTSQGSTMGATLDSALARLLPALPRR
jgi:thiol-disulfide isomerase/thioredoxin